MEEEELLDDPDCEEGELGELEEDWETPLRLEELLDDWLWLLALDELEDDWLDRDEDGDELEDRLEGDGDEEELLDLLGLDELLELLDETLLDEEEDQEEYSRLLLESAID